MPGHHQGDGARAAIQIQQRVLGGKGGIFHRLLVKPLGLGLVDLVKRQRGKGKLHTCLLYTSAYGWLPDMFRQIIRGAKDFLQEVIFKFKLPRCV